MHSRMIKIMSHRSGGMNYEDGVRRVPAACISTEDADLLARFQARGIQPSVRLYMEAQTLPDVTSYNVVGEVVGDTYPDEVGDLARMNIHAGRSPVRWSLLAGTWTRGMLVRYCLCFVR